jgi:hypothetical protein
VVAVTVAVADVASVMAVIVRWLAFDALVRRVVVISGNLCLL